jgi:hypothetical protein
MPKGIDWGLRHLLMIRNVKISKILTFKNRWVEIFIFVENLKKQSKWIRII